ncbi:hypothetical protein [Massilia sp. DD77]|uniref:hypothetical protein n=1 Tax=Massilia sp. DD77 TaxID=3109349 RepID=UPI002FFEB519
MNSSAAYSGIAPRAHFAMKAQAKQGRKRNAVGNTMTGGAMKLKVEKLETMAAPLSNAYWGGFLFVVGIAVLVISMLSRKKNTSNKDDRFGK